MRLPSQPGNWIALTLALPSWKPPLPINSTIFRVSLISLIVISSHFPISYLNILSVRFSEAIVCCYLSEWKGKHEMIVTAK